MENFEENYKKWHTYWSYLKSGLRIFGCIAVIFFGLDIIALAAFLLVAELVGIVEEWV